MVLHKRLGQYVGTRSVVQSGCATIHGGSFHQVSVQGRTGNGCDKVYAGG